MRLSFLGFIAVLFSQPVFSIQQVGVTVTMVGSEANGKVAYVGISPNINSCFAGGVYFRNESEVAKTLSIAMAAKLADKTIRVDYGKDETTGKCVGYSIYMQ